MDSSETDNRERVAVSEGNEPSTAKAPTPLTLAQKLAAIRAECSGVKRENITMQAQSGKEFTIQGHTVDAVLHSIRHLLERYSIWLQPNLESVTYNGTRCDVMVIWTWECLDSGDEKSIRWGGSDTDKGGKGYSKACTNSLKEMLKKTFLITDKEDQKEETENVEHMTDDQLSVARVTEERELRQQAQAKFATLYRKSVQGCGTVAELKALKRENKDQLEALPKVTRDFLEEAYDVMLGALETTSA